MERALDAALLVFRERGYGGSSLLDLGNAMHLTAGSIYKAFKSKREIFLAVFDRYTRARHDKLELALRTCDTGRDKIKAALMFMAESSHGEEGRIGCLVVGAAADISTFDEDMAARVSAAMKKNEMLIRRLIDLGQADGSIACSIDAKTTANTLLCLTQGFRVVGKTGRSRAHMVASVNQIMNLFD